METELVAIPDDALADALRRLPARSLAAARCVCKAWRGIVDDRGLLLPHLLPRSVRGIFLNYVDHHRPHLFARPSSSSSSAASSSSARSPKVADMLSFLPNETDGDWWAVTDHCDGLVVCTIEVEWKYHLCVCNPATQRWTLHPRHPESFRGGTYLAFDPAVSPHYEVVWIADVPEAPEDEADDDHCRLMEWPPSPLQLDVLSSRTGQWEGRSLVREGESVGRVEDMRGRRKHCGVYLNGGLYVYGHGPNFVMRLSLSGNKYQVIKVPIQCKEPYIGKSEGEVCFGIVREGQLRVWNLKESCGEMEWVLRYDLRLYARHLNNGRLVTPWTVQEENVSSYHSVDTAETLQGDGSYQWNSDDDDITSVNVGGERNCLKGFFNILGFHPYKKVIFLAGPFFWVVAYHMNTSKAQFLGKSRPNCYYRNYTNDIEGSFVYTPCMIGELKEDNMDRALEC